MTIEETIGIWQNGDDKTEIVHNISFLVDGVVDPNIRRVFKRLSNPDFPLNIIKPTTWNITEEVRKPYDDIFCANREITIDDIYSIFGLDYHIELSTRPENKYIGDIEIWNESERILKEACEKSNKEFIINPGDGAFYGPKLDFKLKDSMNRIWQCGTIQLDMNLPERFDLTYIDENGNKVRPIMLHRAVLGSIERFIGIITENFAGAFPTWLSPVQVAIVPVNNLYHLEYANKIKEELEKHNIRVFLDDSNEKLSYKMRNTQIKKIPYSIVIGEKEMNENTLTYRVYSKNDQVNTTLEKFIDIVLSDIKEKKLPKDRK